MKRSILIPVLILAAFAAAAQEAAKPAEKLIVPVRMQLSSVHGQAFGLDLATGDTVWRTHSHDEINFAESLPEGVLVGCDDGRVMLLNLTTGATKWDVTVRGGHNVNHFHGAFGPGYLVSDNEMYYWLIARDGRVLWERRRDEEPKVPKQRPTK